VDENGEETNFDWVGNVEGEGADAEFEKQFVEEERDGSREAKRQKNSAASIGNKEELSYEGEWDLSALKAKVKKMNREEFCRFLEVKANEIVDVVVSKKLDEIVDKVMGEEVEDMEMDGEGVGDSEQAKDEDREKKDGKLKELRDVAAIPEATVSPTRCSSRLANSVDEHTLAKAERRAAERNLERNEGISNPLFSPSSMDTLFNFNLDLLGVSVGGRGGSVLDATKFQWDKEGEQQGSEDPEGWGESFNYSESEDECVDEIESLAIKNLCGDLLEEVFDDDYYHLSSDRKIT
jgi:DNA-binding Xre family transcriptional regulator